MSADISSIPQISIPLDAIALTTEERNRAPFSLLQQFLNEKPQSILNRITDTYGNPLSKEAQITAVTFIPPALIVSNPAT